MNTNQYFVSFAVAAMLATGGYGQQLGDNSLVIGNLVFRDLDDDGLFEPADGESGIDGVLVNLYVDVDRNGVVELVDGPPVASTVTSGGGLYQFSALTPGFYGVEVALSNFESGGPLEQWVSSTAKEWVPDDFDNDDNGFHVAPLGVSNFGVIELAVGLEPTSEDGDPNTNLTVDFGFRRALAPAIGNLVFRDLDDDGRFEPAHGESGIDGVLVNLYVDVDRNGVVELVDGSPIASTVTGGGGLYQFSGLSPGFYGVEVALSNFESGGPLEQWASSTAKEWVPDDIDNDDNGFHVAPLGVSNFGVIELAVGLEPTSEDGDPNTNLTVDFGFAPPRPPVFNPVTGHFYRAIRVPIGITWDDARARAEATGGYLATINSTPENDFIVQTFPEAVAENYWLGGFQPGDTPDPDPDPAAGWEWVTGEPFDPSFWAVFGGPFGEPNDCTCVGGKEDALHLWAGVGGWNDLPREFSLPGFVVEYPADRDSDGVPDAEDPCPDSNTAATVVIAGCDGGVPNVFAAPGCTIADLILSCATDAEEHGAFVSCVARLTNALRQAHLITDQEKGRIQRCAATAGEPLP